MNQALTAFVLMFYDFEGDTPFFGKFCVRSSFAPSAKFHTHKEAYTQIP